MDRGTTREGVVATGEEAGEAAAVGEETTEDQEEMIEGTEIGVRGETTEEVEGAMRDLEVALKEDRRQLQAGKLTGYRESLLLDLESIYALAHLDRMSNSPR